MSRERSGVDPAHGEIELREALPHERAAAEEVLARAFLQNPSTLALWGGAQPTIADLKRLNKSLMRSPHARVYVASCASDVAGAMLVADSPRCEHSGLAGLRFLCDAAMALRWRFPQAAVLLRNAGRNHPKWPHRHLEVLGVSPEHQREGIGSRMLEMFTQQADSDGVACFLETDTPEARTLYERFGFSVVNEEQVGPATFWHMWRHSA